MADGPRKLRVHDGKAVLRLSVQTAQVRPRDVRADRHLVSWGLRPIDIEVVHGDRIASHQVGHLRQPVHTPSRWRRGTVASQGARQAASSPSGMLEVSVADLQGEAEVPRQG